MQRWTSGLANADRFAIATAAIGFVHHVDHVLRFDHSGWPFVPQVNTFTYSLLVYPVIIVLLTAREWPRLRAALALLLFLFPTAAHIFVETPRDQYSTWCSSDVNLLGVDSAAAGVAAGTITVLLSLAAFITFLAYLRAARASSQLRSRQGTPAV